MEQGEPTIGYVHSSPPNGSRLWWWPHLVAVGGVFLLFLGQFLALGAAGSAAEDRWLGGLLMVLGVTALTLAMVEIAYGRHRPGAQQMEAPSGRPSRAFAFAWAVLVAQVGAALGFGIIGVGLGLALLDQRGWLIGAPVLALGVWSASYVVPCALGRVRSGGVYLTAQGIEFRRAAQWWRVSWEDVSFAWSTDDELSLGIREAAEHRIEKGRTTRWGWVIGFSHRYGQLSFDCRFLAVSPLELANQIGECLADPAVRDSIGDPYRTW